MRKTWLEAIALGAIVLGIVYAMAFSWAYTPVVYESYTTHKCVKVESWDARYTCLKLPKKYRHVWVK